MRSTQPRKIRSACKSRTQNYCQTKRVQTQNYRLLTSGHVKISRLAPSHTYFSNPFCNHNQPFFLRRRELTPKQHNQTTVPSLPCGYISTHFHTTASIFNSKKTSQNTNLRSSNLNPSQKTPSIIRIFSQKMPFTPVTISFRQHPLCSRATSSSKNINKTREISHIFCFECGLKSTLRQAHFCIRCGSPLQWTQLEEALSSRPTASTHSRPASNLTQGVPFSSCSPDAPFLHLSGEKVTNPDGLRINELGTDELQVNELGIDGLQINQLGILPTARQNALGSMATKESQCTEDRHIEELLFPGCFQVSSATPPIPGFGDIK